MKGIRQILADFDAGRYDVLCNSMLLTEGWDCPTVDCIVVLRPTKMRGLYCQMIGRGTRISPGKDHLLLLDFLWLTERHDLCRPACLIAENAEVSEAITKRLQDADEGMDLEEAEALAQEDVVAQREAALAEKLKEMRRRKRKLVDPLQFEMSIHAADLTAYQPSFGWELEKIRADQAKSLEKLGIFPDEIESAGKTLEDQFFLVTDGISPSSVKAPVEAASDEYGNATGDSAFGAEKEDAEAKGAKD